MIISIIRNILFSIMSYFICGCFCLLWCIWYIFDISVWLVRFVVIYLSPFCGWSGLLWYICLHCVVGQVGCDLSVSLSDWSFLLSLVCYDISFFFLIGQVLAVFTEVGINPTLYFLVFGESLLNGEFNTLLWLELIILIDN